MIVLSRSVVDRLLSYFLYCKQWIFLLFALPTSPIYCYLSNLFLRVIFFAKVSPKNHSRKVQALQQRITKWVDTDHKQASLSSHFHPEKADFLPEKAVADLNVIFRDILHIDYARQSILVEPFVTVGQILDTLLPDNFAIPIVPESEDLTICGLIDGIGLDSSSHLYGLFKDICICFDIVTANGEVVHCSDDENRDLFYAIPFAHGTLGYIVAAELKIIPVKPFIKLEYIPAYSLNETVHLLAESSDGHSFDFVEALMFSEESAIIVRGKFEEPGNHRVNHFGRWWKPWFYVHVAKFLACGKTIEFVPTRDYYCRHTRSYFWMMRDIIPFANHWSFRYFLGWLSPPKIQILKLTKRAPLPTLYDNATMVQDMLVPLGSLEKTLHFIFKNIKIFPIWLCPVLCFNKPGFVHPSVGKDEFYVDVGTYGTVGISDYHPIECTRAYEAFVRRMHGHQMLYADSYQTREEFSQMFDRSLYDTMRSRLPLCMQGFPDIFDKTTRSSKL